MSMFTVQPGEKWAAVCLDRGWCENLDDEIDCGDGTWVISSAPIRLPEHWRDWIGSVHAERVDRANLWLIAKTASKKPEVLDAENQRLSRTVSILSLALQTAIPLECDQCFILGGANVGGDLQVREFGQSTMYFPSWGIRAIPVDNVAIARAREIAVGLDAIFSDDRFMRVRRGFNALWRGLEEHSGQDRLQQFIRALDSIMRSGDAREFGRRGGAFAGPASEKELRECYKMRSQSEHLGDVKNVLPIAQDALIEEHAQHRVRQMEMLARHVYGRLAVSPARRNLFRDRAIRNFWKKPEAERTNLWGPAIDISQVS